MPSAHKPDKQSRALVKTLSGLGVVQEDICAIIGLGKTNKPTLHKYYRAEIDLGLAEANAKVASSLFNMATVGGNVAAAIFWMKARCGWSEKLILAGDKDNPLNAVGPVINVYKSYVTPATLAAGPARPAPAPKTDGGAR